jgi:hypothetical protein
MMLDYAEQYDILYSSNTTDNHDERLPEGFCPESRPHYKAYHISNHGSCLFVLLVESQSQCQEFYRIEFIDF